MPFELFNAERERCVTDLRTVVVKRSELEEALNLETAHGIQRALLEAALTSCRAEIERLEDRIDQLDASIASLQSV